MRREYKTYNKPLAIRTVELLQGLQLIGDALNAIRDGQDRYLIVLSGQLRSLVAEKSKEADPLLIHVAEALGEELLIHCMPGVNNPDFPEKLRKDLILEITGPPVSLERKLPAQVRMTISDFLGQEIIQFQGVKYTPRNIIEWYANKAGGAHYSRAIPADFAAILAVDIMGMQPLVNLLVQIGDAVLASGRQLLRKVVDFEIHTLLVIPPKQEAGSVLDVNYLFDSKYDGSPMRISLTLNSRLMPSFFVSGLQGSWARVDSDRIVDWSSPRVLHATLRIEDDLSTTMALWIDDMCVGRIVAKAPLFVLADPLQYESCHNKAVDGAPQKFSFGVNQILVYGGELGPESRATTLLQLISRRTDPDLRVCCYGPSAFATKARGTNHLEMSGKPNRRLAREVLAA